MAVQIREVLLQQKPLGSGSPHSRRVVSAQDGARQKLKICQNRLLISFLNLFLKILYIVCLLDIKKTGFVNLLRLFLKEIFEGNATCILRRLILETAIDKPLTAVVQRDLLLSAFLSLCEDDRLPSNLRSPNIFC